jgi:uncharacterized protein (DUF952 family)
MVVYYKESKHMILHITRRDEWQQAQQAGQYIAPSLAAQGFIHCSTAEQAITVANTFYANQRDLVLLVIDPQRLSAELRWEPPDHPVGDADTRAIDANPTLFPHIYGALNLDAVVRVLDFPPDADGSFALPQGIA